MSDADITARLDHMIAVLEARTTLILSRVDLSESPTRSFTWRDEQMQEILARLEALEERLPPA